MCTQMNNLAMSRPDDIARAAQVEQFAADLAVSSMPPRPDESEDLGQLRSDFVEYQKQNSAQSYAKIKEIENRLVGNRPDEMALIQAREHLTRAMEEFQDDAPDHSLPTHHAWTWADVESAVSTVQVRWKQKHEKSRVSSATAVLRKMCHGLHNHSTILKMVPSENNYVSIISGAVSTIIKASATYIGVTESFANGIVEINDAVAGVETQVYDSDLLQALVMRLYSYIFTYLRKFMKWHTDRRRTRFFESFNENLKEGFQDDIRKVKEICTTLSRQVQNHMSADVKVTSLLVKNQNANLEHLLRWYEEDVRSTGLRDAAMMDAVQNMIHDGFKKSEEEYKRILADMMEQYEDKVRQHISGEGITKILLQKAWSQGESHANRQLPHLQLTSESVGTEIGPGLDTVDEVYSGFDVKASTARFEDFHDWEKVYPFAHDPQTVMPDPDVLSRLHEFTRSMSSQILYLYDEPHPLDHPHFLKDAVGTYIALARELSIPVVSYFCTLSQEKPAPNRTRESTELCAAMYSMLRQLINLLPSSFATNNAIFTSGALQKLDGTLRTWGLALELLGELVQCLKLPVLLVVVDGLNLVEDGPRSHIHSHVTALVCRLRSMAETPEEDRIVKVLFSTAGLSNTLSSHLQDSACVCCRDSTSPITPRSRFKFRHSY